MNRVIQILYILSILAFEGCTDPNKISLEFYKSTQRIHVLNHDYYIKSVKIMACIPNTYPIRTMDTCFVEYSQQGSRGGTDISLNNMGAYYALNGTKDPKELLQQPCLNYRIKLERFEIRKRNTIPDTALIVFNSRDLVNEISVFTSHPSNN